jgi:pyruvate dehydrogenase E1 component
MTVLGTDGFGRSDNRGNLRDFFEIDAKSVVAASLSALARRGEFDGKKAAKAITDLGLDADRPPSWTVDI